MLSHCCSKSEFSILQSNVFVHCQKDGLHYALPSQCRQTDIPALENESLSGHSRNT